MFISAQNFRVGKLTDANLPSATLFKLHVNSPFIFGLLGIHENKKQLVPVEEHLVADTNGESNIQFVKSQADGEMFQERPHLLIPSIKFELDYKSIYQTINREIEIGSLARTGTELQIIAKTSLSDKTRVAVTLSDNFEDWGQEIVYFSAWKVFLNEDSHLKKICEKNETDVVINILR